MTPQRVFSVLLAEDNAADVLLVREALSAQLLECRFHVIKDGEEAITFIEKLEADPQQSRLDLVLLDMHLPKRDGAEVLKALRSTARYSGTPVIVMTTSDSPRDLNTAQKHAALHYFRKPSNLVDFMRLGDIVRGVLERNNLTDSAESPNGSQGTA